MYNVSPCIWSYTQGPMKTHTQMGHPVYYYSPNKLDIKLNSKLSREIVLMDLEDFLPIFTVRQEPRTTEDKENNNKRINHAFNKNSEVRNVIPILLADVVNLALEGNVNTFTTLNGNLLFRSFIIHAHVLGRLPDSKFFYKYAIDDSSACAEMAIRKNHKELKEIQSLQMKVQAFALHTTAPNGKQQGDYLQLLLTQAKTNVDCSHLPIGSKIFIHGRPFKFFDKVIIDAINIYEDAGVNRSMEIAFKDQLLRFYAKFSRSA